VSPAARKPRVLHLHLRGWDELLSLAAAGLTATGPVVVHLHAAASRPVLTARRGDLRSRLLGAPTEALLLRRATLVVVAGDTAGRLAQELGAHTVVVAPPAVPPPPPDLSAMARPLRGVRGRRIVAPGPLVARRRPVDLVRYLAPQPADTHLVLLGDGPEREAVRVEATRRGLEHRVHVVTRPTWTEMEAHLRHADVVATAAGLGEGPEELLQAMRLGRPVIATRADDRERSISSGVDGVLVPPGDDWAFAGGLRRLLTDAPFAGELGAAAARRVAARSWPDVGAEILRALDGGAGRPRPGYAGVGARPVTRRPPASSASTTTC
jgi:glycosyltransferase involved in cell wall biosynthesis